ncbi:hypothetical protein O9X99_09415 [Agrobacterium salinitolerans]|uniref:DUF2336 domain-containing protein n=1 Tax=Agrobacterium salinitolerans TaxID=1183413 RepID=A0ABY3BRP7_9HYPH|nr:MULTISPECIES: hypothetical protein [Agrobacterium]MCZ7891891.1 hypothetical protein [Agrobacterium salinitolerans]TRA94056.1 hypothetical protein EXN23_10260 [Agrobacterium salinitolerans]
MNSYALPSIDAWTASSLLQKAIRRGEADYAQAAALALYRMRGNALWRRLLLIAFEDVGPADPALCVNVSEWSNDPELRKSLGTDHELLLYLTGEMCLAAKNREADYLICAAKQAPFSEDLRAAMASRSLENRVLAAGDCNATLLDRAVASWMASGVNGGAPQVLREGNLSGLIRHFVALGVPEDFASSVAYASKKTSEPIVLMAPLLLLAIGRETSSARVVTEALPPSVLCNGIPSWVFDKHTRLGKSAVRQLLKENREVRDCLAAFVPEYKSIQVAEMAAFYADAVALSSRLVWPQSDELYALGLRTDMTKIGTPDDGVAPITQLLSQHLNQLNDIRKRLREGNRSEAFTRTVGMVGGGK